MQAGRPVERELTKESCSMHRLTWLPCAVALVVMCATAA